MTGKPAWRFLRPALLVGLPLVAVTATVMPSAYAQSPPVSRPPRRTARSAATPVRNHDQAAPPPPVARPAPSPPPVPTSAKPTNTAEWMALPIDDLRSFAHGGDLRAMEELARRLVSGIGVPQDSQSGAGWLLRAAEAGSPAAAFNVGVMYERGFVVERDSTKAVEWYQKAADGNVAVAKHNLALLLRDGKGAPRDGKRRIELLRSAARQGMTGSMFLLGDIYERGDAASRDAALALAWFAVTVEFERQVNQAPRRRWRRTAQQRVETLQRVPAPAPNSSARRRSVRSNSSTSSPRSLRRSPISTGRSPPAAAGLAVPPATPRDRTTARRRSGHWLAQGAGRTRPGGPAGADRSAAPQRQGRRYRGTGNAGGDHRLREERRPARNRRGVARGYAALRAIAQHDAVARSLPPPPRSVAPRPDPGTAAAQGRAPAPPKHRSRMRSQRAASAESAALAESIAERPYASISASPTPVRRRRPILRASCPDRASNRSRSVADDAHRADPRHPGAARPVEAVARSADRQRRTDHRRRHSRVPAYGRPRANRRGEQGSVRVAEGRARHSSAASRPTSVPA